MLGQRNYVNRMSQLQMQGQSSALTHRRFTTSQYHHQRSHPNYSINQRANGISMHPVTYSDPHQRRSDYRMIPQWYLQTITMPQTTNRIPMKIHRRNNNDNYLQSYDVIHRHNGNLMRAIRSNNNLVENSLYPHGDPLPQDYLNEWDQRPECPRLKWTHQENPSWQPPIQSRTGEYSGTELILASDAVSQTNKRKDYQKTMTFKPTTRPLMPSLEQHYEEIAKNILDICGHSDNSEGWSVKSNSSLEYF